MSDVIQTIKVKPWGKDQGEFVEINADDFDPKHHKLIAGESLPEPVAEPEVEAAPANPDDLVSPPLEQVANEEVAAPSQKAAPKPAKRRRKKGK